ncbi:MAG: hypothetical protein H6667_08685 [Ardenticatenaceae bacterium]|nr:hypothetical protein [Ardenticatenaceae bacterium]
MRQRGTFNYKGSASVTSVSDGGWHTMTLAVRRGRASVTIDDVVIADAIPLEYVSGYAGLFASDGHIAFDDVQITPAASLIGQLGTEETVDLGLNFADNGRAGLLFGPGQWQVADGKVSQQQLDQFDRFAALDIALAPDFRFSSDIHYVDGVMSGGLIFNMQRRDSKAESHIVAFTNDGTYLQWGQFDVNGNFVFLGGQDIDSVQNDEWHNLTVITSNGRFEVRLNDNTIATDIPLVYDSGYAGLFGSNGWIEFDNMTVQGNGRRLITNEN